MANKKSTRKYISVKALVQMIEEKLKTANNITIENIALKSKVGHGKKFIDHYDHFPTEYVDFDKFKYCTNADSGCHIQITFRNCQLCDVELAMISHNNNNGLNIWYENSDVMHFNFRISRGIHDIHFNNCKVQNCKFKDANDYYIYGARTEYTFDDDTTCEYCVFENCKGSCITHYNHEKFIHCKFGKCNFTNCDLSRVTFTDCEADILTTGFYMACPEKGDYIGFKKACVYTDDKGKNITTQYQKRKFSGHVNVNYVIVELRIPSDAKRSSATTNKCRASKATVISITSIDEKKKYKKAIAAHDREFTYEVNKTVTPRNGFEENRWDECAPGIHHFITRREAVDYHI